MIKIDHVVCPIDLSDSSLHALDRATAVAGWFGARLTAVHVFSGWPEFELVPTMGTVGAPVQLDHERRQRVVAALEGFVARRHQLSVPVEIRLVEGADIAAEIVASTGETGLLVIGSHGRRGFHRLMLGSVTEEVVRIARGPVLVVPPHDTRPADAAARPKRVLCPVDFSESSTAGLRFALQLAEERDAQLTVLHVLEVPFAVDELSSSESKDDRDARLAAEAETLVRLRRLVPAEAHTYCTVETAVAHGKPSPVILDRSDADHADLIVMGVNGRSGFHLWAFGSNSQIVARAAKCPVLILRS